jgi:serine/threonine protein kinase
MTIRRLESLGSLYRLEESFAGGEAMVHKAWDVDGDRPVAIKIPNEIVRSNERWLQRFEREARVLAALEHPNVRKVHHYYEPGVLDEGCYLICEWMDQTLADRIAAGPVEWETATTVLSRILAGIDAIHGAEGEGLVHRDVKPENVFVSVDLSEVKVGDLDVAAPEGVQQTTRITPRYTAPEFFREGASIDRRADLYSVGVLAYELFLGEEGARAAFPEIYEGAPDTRTQEMRWLNWHLDPERRPIPLHELPGSGVPESVSRVIERLLRKDPDERFASAAEAQAALDGAESDSSPAAAPFRLMDLDQRGRKPRREKRKKKAKKRPEAPVKRSVSTRVAAAVVGCVALLGAIAVLYFPRSAGDEIAARNARATAMAAREAALAAGADGDPPIAELALGNDRGATGDGAFGERAYDVATQRYFAARDFYEQARQLALARAEPEIVLGIARLGSEPDEVDAALALCKDAGANCARADYASETPRDVALEPFEMDRFEVTNEAYARFTDATGHVTTAERRGFSYRALGGHSVLTPGASWRSPEGPGSDHRERPDHPVVHVSAADAEAYCSWAGGRLPSEDEWEYTARGAARRVWPWGDVWEAGRLGESRGAGTAPVGAFANGATPDGIHDLAGNVWEWTASDLDGDRVLKGGSWVERNPANLRAAAGRLSDPAASHADDGFRCVRDLEAWPA